MNNRYSIRTENLNKILLKKYLPAEQINRQMDSNELKGSMYERHFLEAYEILEGKNPGQPIKFEPVFLEFGRFCILLDEALHFNRYRAKTLRSSFYESISAFPAIKYRTYCRNYETECLKIGTSKPHWTNSEAELHFGPSQQSGDLGLNGSSGWKLIAMQDLLTDLICRKRKIRLLRISIWDDLMVNKHLKKLNQILVSPSGESVEPILKFIERRIIGLYADDF